MARSPILITSLRRTGATLVRLLLDTHPAICSPGDLQLGGLCDSLYTAVDATQGPRCAEETIEARRRRCIADTRRVVDRLMDSYCAIKEKERWCEKAGALECLPLLMSVFPDAACVLLHRQCLDVVRSSIEMYGSSPPRAHLGASLDRHRGNLTAAWIEQWCEGTEKLLALEAESAGRAVRVRYEDLVRDPEVTLRTILASVGEPWVPGLAERAFTTPHTLGHGDPKMILSHGVAGDRVGKGGALDLTGVPDQVLDRMRRLLDALGYDQPRSRATRHDPTRADAHARGALTSVAELFDVHFPRQLARYNHRLQADASVLGIRVDGAEPGAWTIQVDAAGARIAAGESTADCTVVFQSADLLDVVNQRITVAAFRDRVAVEGDRAAFDRAFSERLLWTMFGDDLRPTLPEANVHRMVARTVERVPDSVAVACGDEHVSYAALAAAAARLAGRLRAIGVAPESRVAIALPRSCDLIVALMGTLASGGAYVPLDVDAPAGPLAALLRDAGVACVVTSKSLEARVPDVGVPILVLDDGGPQGDVVSGESRLAGDSLCYVMYTSGTTGEPKGVAVSHAAVSNLLESMQRRPGLTAGDALLAVTPITFDIASLEVFLPLITGARLAIAPPHAAADGVDLMTRLVREEISVLQATPATWRLLLDAGWHAPAGFRALCGGEALPSALARRLIAAAGEVWNCYGPTETTIWSTVGRLRQPAEPVTIGEPIANTRVHLLDRRLDPMPPGSAGHLHLAGAGLARGYLGRARLTAERFIPDGARGAYGARLYDTGDLARYEPAGALECLGRTDDQIKLRGYRIEPGAIENVLERHPQVASAVVRTWNREGDDALLVAYVVAADHAPAEPHVLRDFARQHLPAYMIPAIIIRLDAFPLTRHGKVDRHALPAPDRWRPASSVSYADPRGDRERSIAEIWHRLLRVERIGRHENFFDLGGTSLLFAEVRVELHRMGCDVSIVDMYQYPTIALLSAYVAHTSPDAPPEAAATATASRAEQQRRALAARTRPGGGTRPA
jgi:amino acid adenylation domain-containing protein